MTDHRHTDQVPETTTDRPTLLTTVEAALYLGLAKATLNKWRVYGDGPRFIKLGRAVRYRKEDLDRYLAQQTKRSTSEA